MRGAPHKIIRHPNMPRGVFHLLWECLGRSTPVGGYVQNLSKDGTHYWVFAVMVPTDDGYLSVRLKPLGPRLTRISKLYLDLRRRELDDDISPQESANALLDALKKDGSKSYQHFMVTALNE
ncbi:PAS domain-containing protein [Roseobacter sp. S98]|uniref:PAS domain-containing protein n=1 Tax=Roseobacter algicola (ex Choi et al. 2025) (nom. illeg.) TaxID=3092138 RepID=UPI003F50F737